MPRKTLLSWSSGKDSAWALHILRHDPEIEMAGLFTVINARHQRVAMRSGKQMSREDRLSMAA